MDIRKKQQLPHGLSTRAGWAAYFEAGRRAEPHLHQIEPTNHCPFACIMCPRPAKMTRQLGFMDLALFRRVISEVAGFAEPTRSQEIELFHFGESLLHPQIHEMIAIASRRDLKVVLSVNAPALTPGITERILKARPWRIIISLDGFDAATYRKIRGPAADFDRALGNLENLARSAERQDSKTEIVVRMIELHANRDQVEPFKKHWQELGFRAEIREFFAWNSSDLVDLGRITKYPPNMPCPFPWQHLIVQFNGDVVPCCRDYNGQAVLGTVRDQTLGEIWNSPEYAAFRRQHASGEFAANNMCRRCTEIYFTPAAPDTTPLSRQQPAEEDLAQCWRQAVKAHSDRTFLIADEDGSRFTYSDADRVVSAIANRLRADNLGPGHRIVLWTPVHVEAILFFWAAALLGAVVVVLDPDDPPPRIQELLSRVGPALALVDPDLRQTLPELPCPVLLTDRDAAPDRPGALSEWLREEDYQAPAPPLPQCPADHPGVILFTSGTNGRRQGVVLARQALARSGRVMAETYRWRPGDVLLSPGDLHTMSGFRNPCIAAVRAGAAVLVADGVSRASAIALARAARRHRVTVLTTVPALLRQLLLIAERFESSPLASLRMVLSTGSRLSESLRHAFTERFAVPVLNYFGLTETTGLCAGEKPEVTGTGRGNIGVGIAAQLTVVDRDGNEVADGETGELWIQSPNRMLGYLDDPQASRDAFSGPWLKTGDLARRESDDTVSLLGRRSEIIKNRHGEVVAAAELEQALLDLPDISDVGVCPITNDNGDEAFAAFIVALVHPDPGELEGWLRRLRTDLAGRIGHKKLPQAIHLRPTLPRNSAGKFVPERSP